MSIADLALHYGTESTYGTAATLTKSYETQVDDWKRAHEYLQSQGFIGGQHTIRKARSVPVNMGGSGSIQIDVLNKSMGLLLRDMFGATTGPTLLTGTAYQSTHATAANYSRSATIQTIRTKVDGTTQQFTHKGCVCTGWEFNCEAGTEGFLNMKAMFDVQDIDTTTAAGSNAYAAAADPFHWGQCVVTVGGSAVDMRKLNLKGDYKLNTDRRFLRGNMLKKQPRLGDIPEFTGELEGEFENLTQYTNFVNGTSLVAQFKWTGALISGAHFFEFVIDMPSIQYTGESPEQSLTDSPKQTLPFVVLHDDATGPAITVSLKSTDVTF
jgi:hypothetical protein